MPDYTFTFSLDVTADDDHEAYALLYNLLRQNEKRLANPFEWYMEEDVPQKSSTRLFYVYYLKPGLGYDERDNPTCELFEDYWTLTRIIGAIDLDDVFHKMQGELWSPNGEMSPYIKSLGVAHTSMSVGDIVQNKESGQYFQVKNIGWRPLPQLKNKGEQ